VQSESAPAGYESWKAGEIRSKVSTTFAEGIASGVGAVLPQSIMKEKLDDFTLVPDAEIRQAMVWLLEKAHTLAEGAGAAPLAAIVRMKDQLAGKKVGMVISGGNSSLAHLREALDAADRS
jgi:threonine dehydratase